jgi:hypothetical protein
MKKYPDVSQILARKAVGRKILEQLPANEKLKILETLRKATEHVRSEARMVAKPAKQK